MKFIERENYINQILPFIDSDLIKVIIGQRRVGKSYLLYQLIDFIKVKDSSAQIIYINKERFEFDEIKNYIDLIKYVEGKLSKEVKNYLFIDEIQDIEEFERGLRHLALENDLDIYCTGSNANLLSGELATYLSGRYIEFKVQGLSFKEFLKFNDFENSDESLHKYLLWGSLPFIKNLPKENDVIEEYLKNIYSTIVYKDIVSRFNIRNVFFLENLIKFLANNSGSIISSKKISDYLKSQKINMTPQIVLNYLSYLKQACLVHNVKRTAINGKKVFEVNEKIYFEDWGIMNAIIGFNNMDIGKVIENVVFSHLKSQGYSILVGTIGDKEIDFIGEKGGNKIYIQACYLLSDEKVKLREYGNLKLIKDNYPKLVVSLDLYAPKNIEGIQHIYLRDFLLSENFSFL